jgi:hypothetical protein
MENYNDHDASESSSTTLVTATMCVTFQFLRLAVDLIQVASTMDDEKKSTVKKSSSSSALMKEEDASTTTKKSHDNNNGKKGGSSNYGSVEEGKPLVPSSSTNGNNASNTTTTTAANPATTTTTTNWWERFKTHRSIIFLCTMWMILSLLFLLATAITATTTATTAKNTSSSTTGVLLLLLLFPGSLLACSSLAFFIEAILSWRDVERERYGTFQRLLQLLVVLVLWAMYATRAVQEWSEHHDDEEQDDDAIFFLSRLNFTILIAATLAVVLVLLDAWLAQKRPTAKRRMSMEKAAAAAQSKAQLSWETWGYLLKPYFWPDATNTTALWNRACAVGTWICVVSSKVCGLVAPLMLGKAATALAHQDYRHCIQFAIWHATFVFLASTFKECQSLIYLRVAQAAFVQLSETAFDHLHHLSLDWHLRKKLGEVRLLVCLFVCLLSSAI